MIRIDQSLTINAPLEQIWEFLSDAPRVGKCMPGVGSVDPAGDDRYKVTLGVKIGPIKARFSGYVAYEDVLPMERMDVTADWKDKTTSSKAQLTSTIKISETSADGYEINVTGEATVLGSLSKYGQGIADKIASQYAEKFAENMQLELNGEFAPDAK